MNYNDITRAYELRGRETAHDTVRAQIERDYRSDRIDLREKHNLDAKNHYCYVNTPTEDEIAMRPVTPKAEYWIDKEKHIRYKRIGNNVFRQCGDLWRFDHAER